MLEEEVAIPKLFPLSWEHGMMKHSQLPSLELRGQAQLLNLVESLPRRFEVVTVWQQKVDQHHIKPSGVKMGCHLDSYDSRGR